MAPNVIVRLHYYDANASKRSFYNSSQKDDYLGYVDKGIQANAGLDYIEYAGNKEKSLGIFCGDRLLTKEDKKILRDKLRNTKSCIWDMVISFSEEYGKKNVYDLEQAMTLIHKNFPKFLKHAGLNPNNITWYAGLHTNTENRHIHLSFFENEPQRFNQKTKTHKYHFGKIQMPAVDAFKMNIEKHFLSPVEGIKRVRKLLTDGARIVSSQPYSTYSKTLKSLLRKLYEQIPYEGKVAYENDNMKSCRNIVDGITTCVLKNGYLREEYISLSLNLSAKDNEILQICESHKIRNPEKYLLSEKFQKDLYRRMGNVIIKEVLKQRKTEILKAREVRHAKALQKTRKDSLLYLFEQTVRITEEVNREAIECFEEYLEKLKLAEIERQLEESEMG